VYSSGKGKNSFAPKNDSHETEIVPTLEDDDDLPHIDDTWYSGAVPLGVEDDINYLSELQVYTRADLVEVFSATEEDMGAFSILGRNQSIVRGQVGIRCMHCKFENPAKRGQQATSYPSLISNIYNSVQQMRCVHLDSCPSIPQEIRAKMKTLMVSTSARGSGFFEKQYWIDSAKRLGLVDTGTTTSTPQGQGRIYFGRDPLDRPLPPLTLTGPSSSASSSNTKKVVTDTTTTNKRRAVVLEGAVEVSSSLLLSSSDGNRTTSTANAANASSSSVSSSSSPTKKLKIATTDTVSIVESTQLLPSTATITTAKTAKTEKCHTTLNPVQLRLLASSLSSSATEVKKKKQKKGKNETVQSVEPEEVRKHPCKICGTMYHPSGLSSHEKFCAIRKETGQQPPRSESKADRVDLRKRNNSTPPPPKDQTTTNISSTTNTTSTVPKTKTSSPSPTTTTTTAASVVVVAADNNNKENDTHMCSSKNVANENSDTVATEAVTVNNNAESVVLSSSLSLSSSSSLSKKIKPSGKIRPDLIAAILGNSKRPLLPLEAVLPPPPTSSLCQVLLPYEEFEDDLRLNLGTSNGAYYQRRTGSSSPGNNENNDGQVMVRLQKKRFIIIDYSIVPNTHDFQQAVNSNHHIHIPDGAGVRCCVSNLNNFADLSEQERVLLCTGAVSGRGNSSDSESNIRCKKIGIPIVLYDSNPNEVLLSRYVKSGLCFTCQVKKNERARKLAKTRKAKKKQQQQQQLKSSTTTSTTAATTAAAATTTTAATTAATVVRNSVSRSVVGIQEVSKKIRVVSVRASTSTSKSVRDAGHHFHEGVTTRMMGALGVPFSSESSSFAEDKDEDDDKNNNNGNDQDDELEGDDDNDVDCETYVNHYNNNKNDLYYGVYYGDDLLSQQHQNKKCQYK